MKAKNIELSQTVTLILIKEADDFLIEREEGQRERKIEKPIDEMNLSEMSNIIHSFDHPKIKDWPNRPYKTILLVNLYNIGFLLTTMWNNILIIFYKQILQ